MKIKNGLGLVAASFFGLFFAGTASAVPCSDSESGIFEDAANTDPAYTACVDGTTDNDQGAGGIVAAGFDGHTDWVEIGQLFGDLDTAATSGTFTVDPTWYNFDEVLIVLKNGPTCPDGVRWSGYYLEPGLSGTLYWVYGSGPHGGSCSETTLKELSHAFVYGRGETGSVPEPGTVALLGLGLIAVGISRRRKRVS